jgi:hypothetical protein
MKFSCTSLAPKAYDDCFARFWDGASALCQFRQSLRTVVQKNQGWVYYGKMR